VATAQTVVDLASVQLNDEDNDDWTESILLGYLNQAMKALCRVVPEEFTIVERVAAAAGAQQAVPANCMRLITVIASVYGGVVRGLTRFDRSYMDAIYPLWYNADASQPRQFAHDQAVNSDTYWLYPPAPTSTSVDLEYVRVPADLDLADALPVDDTFVPALVEYVLFRAYAEDKIHDGSDARAALHFQMFLTAVGEVKSG